MTGLAEIFVGLMIAVAVLALLARKLTIPYPVLFVIGGQSNNADIHETLRAIADALREHFSAYGPTPLYVVVGRGGPNLVRGMGAMRDSCEVLGIPYRIFGFDSDISEVIQYAKRVDAWMKSGGRSAIAARLSRA